jgi:hypothetical protein
MKQEWYFLTHRLKKELASDGFLSDSVVPPIDSKEQSRGFDNGFIKEHLGCLF